MRNQRVSGLRINLTEQEATSVAREYSVLPTGGYVCNITDIKVMEVKPGAKNAGKPYWNVKFVVDQGSKYDGKHIYSNIMLFSGAAYQIKQLVEAVFPDLISGNELTVPDADAFLGKRVLVYGQKYSEGTDIKKGGKPTGEKRDRDSFEVKSFKAVVESERPSSNTSLLS